MQVINALCEVYSGFNINLYLELSWIVAELNADSTKIEISEGLVGKKISHFFRDMFIYFSLLFKCVQKTPDFSMFLYQTDELL